MSQPTTPVIAEHDDWMAVSHSSAARTEAELKADLGATPEEIAAGAPPPADPPPPAAGDPPPPAAPAAGDGDGEDEGDPNADPTAPPPAQATDDEPPAPGDAPKKKKTHWAQPKIDRLTKEREDEKRAREAAETRAADLERQLTDARRTATSPPPPPATDPAPAPAATAPLSGQPKPLWAGPGGMEEGGKTYDEFLEAREAWLIAENESRVTAAIAAERTRSETERQASQERTAQESRRREVEAAHRARVAAAQTRYPDWAEKTKDVNKLDSPALIELVVLGQSGPDLLYHLGTHPDEKDRLQAYEFTPAILDAIHEIDESVKVKVLSHLAQHPDEFERLRTLSPVKAAAELGILSTRVDVAPAGGPTAPVPPKTHAKPPLRPPSGSAPTAAGGGGGPAPDDLDALPDEEYVEAMNRKDREASRAHRL